jgi:hypothetical protein
MVFDNMGAANPGDQNNGKNWLDLDGTIVQVY